MPKINTFVSRQLLLNKLVAHFSCFNLLHSHQKFPSSKFNLANRREAPHCTVGQCRDERRVNDWGSMPQLLTRK